VGKNLVGAFYQPALVLCDANCLNTLPLDIFRDGCAEVIKYGVLYDPALFDHLAQTGLDFDREQVITRCVELKRDVVAEDEFDTGMRQLLNLGHTLAHALEKVSNFQVPHGEAVAVGMRAVSKRVPEVGEILDIYGLGDISSLDAYASRDELAAAMFYDKKRSGGKITLVVPYAVGDCRLEQVYVENVWEWMQ
jgi:3-dehydroquinate synthase